MVLALIGLMTQGILLVRRKHCAFFSEPGALAIFAVGISEFCFERAALRPDAHVLQGNQNEKERDNAGCPKNTNNPA